MVLNIGVIGTGMIGQDHIRRLTGVLSGVRVAGVCDIDPDCARAAAPEGADVFNDPQKLVSAGNIDAVLICSWGPAHEEQLLACIGEGKPVFCEKPLVTGEQAALNVMQAEIAHGRRLVQVGFMRRFDSDYRALRALIADGSLGAPLIFHSAHRNPSVPEGSYTSDMLLNDTLVHDADIARWLLEDEICGVEVRVPRRSTRGGDLRDPVLVLLHMAGGAIACVEISVNIAYGYDIRGTVSCETGVAALPNRPAPVISDVHGIRQAIPEDWRARFREAYDQELHEWISAARNGTATGPSVWDGYAATLVADAALRAVKSGRIEEIMLCERHRIYR